jgi:hypothetical protein
MALGTFNKVRRSRGITAAVILVLVMTGGARNAAAQEDADGTFHLSRIPTISDIPDEFVGIWDWDTPRQSCGTTVDSYGQTINREDGTLCQWPIDQIEKVMNGRGRAWRQFTLNGGDEAVSPRWSCGQSSFGTTLTEGYLRAFYKTPDALLMHFEHSNWIRSVFTDGRKHPPIAYSFSHGHSIGWMEGETFVVETTNFTWDPDGYDDHSHVARSHLATWTERYTLKGNDVMELVITVKDPLFLKEPFTFNTKMKRAEPDQKLVGSWDCDPESALKELYQTTKNPYDDDTTPAKYDIR